MSPTVEISVSALGGTLITVCACSLLQPSLLLPRARMREGVKKSVLSVCLSVCQSVSLSVCQSVSLSGEKF